MPLFMLPQLVSQLVNARVALNRLQEFLAAEEQPALPEKPAAAPGVAGQCQDPHAGAINCAGACKASVSDTATSSVQQQCTDGMPPLHLS